MLEDVEGRRWHSVRDAFWQGHLGFPAIHHVEEQHDLLLRVLSAIDRRWLDGAENRRDLFGGDMAFWRFYLCWLFSIGLVQADTRDAVLEAPLSDEGRSVLLMLQATREPAWVPLPFISVMDSVRLAKRTSADEEREGALVAFERDAARLPYVFAREMVHRSHTVTLTGFGAGARLPVRRVMWSQSFADDRVRDDFFAWLAERVDRWEHWGSMAYSKGAAALTSHLLNLAVVRPPSPSAP